MISLGALFAIPSEEIIKNKEYALAAGAGNILGSLGTNLVILGAILATSSAISGTVFGASRQMSVIAKMVIFQIGCQLERTIFHKMQLSEWQLWQVF
jgi:amino acid transporter